MKLYSYVITVDDGFAPNPFYGYCTLTTCKPRIRKNAEVGDWVIGTGSKRLGYEGKLIFAMKIKEKIDYKNYWNDQRFSIKKPKMYGTSEQQRGDNIYYYENTEYHQVKNRYHDESYMEHDLSGNYALISEIFYYFGRCAISIPADFRNDPDICQNGQGHKVNFPEEFVKRFLNWLKSNNEAGLLCDPYYFDESSSHSCMNDDDAENCF